MAMNKKIEKIRDEMAGKSWGRGMTPSAYYTQGFDAAWALHERLVGPLIEALNKINSTGGYTITYDNPTKKEHSFFGIMDAQRDAIEKYREEVGE